MAKTLSSHDYRNPIPYVLRVVLVILRKAVETHWMNFPLDEYLCTNLMINVNLFLSKEQDHCFCLA